MHPIRRLEKFVGVIAIGKAFRGGIKEKLFLPNAIRGVGQMDQTRAVMRLFDGGVRLLTGAKALDKIRLMPFVGEVPFVLINDLPAFDHHLPASQQTNP